MHDALRLGRKASYCLSLNQGFAGRRVYEVVKHGRAMADARDNATVVPHASGDLLEVPGSGVVDQGGVAGRGEENAVFAGVDVSSLGHVVELLAEGRVGVVPDLAVLALQKVGRQGEPVGGVDAFFRGKVDFDPGSGEDFEGVEGLADEEACGVGALEKGGTCRSHGDDSAAWWRHFENVMVSLTAVVDCGDSRLMRDGNSDEIPASPASGYLYSTFSV